MNISTINVTQAHRNVPILFASGNFPDSKGATLEVTYQRPYQNSTSVHLLIPMRSSASKLVLRGSAATTTASNVVDNYYLSAESEDKTDMTAYINVSGSALTAGVPYATAGKTENVVPNTKILVLDLKDLTTGLQSVGRNFDIAIVKLTIATAVLTSTTAKLKDPRFWLGSWVTALASDSLIQGAQGLT